MLFDRAVQSVEGEVQPGLIQQPGGDRLPQTREHGASGGRDGRGSMIVRECFQGRHSQYCVDGRQFAQKL
jgi:hypothetical protein